MEGDPLENKAVDTDEEGGEAQHEELQVAVFVAQRFDGPGRRKGLPERVAGRLSAESELASHDQQLTLRLRFGPARLMVTKVLIRDGASVLKSIGRRRSVAAATAIADDIRLA
ncbi:hypothetical protein G4G27_02350 [Sphingomonas sp. So64.6b]|uniref:hypothetical protein n=1 Tax=Sphingomonas sp. So64.6b TaxID=2997354 RepID=UPI001601BC27|nr:hypothetical protein [Sphingomonas sp. So64.6b]QNA82984.1 hypothetical protein G4G27_02350 [Sphingomonas sp. So64.6b]